MRSTGSSFLHSKKFNHRLRTPWGSAALAAFTFFLSAHAQTMKAPDITRTPTLYVVPYAHLDTQWRWEFPQTISEYLLKTMRVNFDYFGKASNEYMLPDCFGFPASLPSILAHAGVKGFSTQKLNAQWQPAPKIGGSGSPEQTPEGIPFNVGRWIGPDGSSVIAALNPGGYGSNVYTDISKTPTEPPPVTAPQLTSEERA